MLFTYRGGRRPNVMWKASMANGPFHKVREAAGLRRLPWHCLNTVTHHNCWCSNEGGRRSIRTRNNVLCLVLVWPFTTRRFTKR